jgi:uncharacterized membrane protein YhaH (DUF805 family)
MEWMILPLKRYFDFQGRSRRMEFWLFVLFNLIVGLVASIIDRLLGFGSSETISSANGFYTRYSTSGPAEAIAWLALLIPNIAVAVRRLHDTNRTGWFVLLPVPFAIMAFMGMGTAIISGLQGAQGVSGTGLLIGGIGSLLTFIAVIVLVVFYCLDGTRGPNRFGPDPKDPHGGMDAEQVFG